LDTVLVVSSDEIKRARAQVESITSETATVDCHPVILDDSEEDTDRFVGNDASSSGLVPKRAPSIPREEQSPAESEPETVTALAPNAPMIDDEEPMEVSFSSIISDADMTPTREEIPVSEERARPPPGKAEPRVTITEVREIAQLDPKEIDTKDVELPIDTAPAEEETTTEERPKAVPRFDDETKPMPKPDIGDIAGAMETVPLNAALVQNVLAQVDARAAARNAGKPVPPLNLSPMNPHLAAPPPGTTPRHAPPQALVQTHPRMGAATTHKGGRAGPPPRRIGVEIFITFVAFLAVAVPALYYLYVTFVR
jgi:hypothetical protein